MPQLDELLSLMNQAMAILDRSPPSAAACHLQNAIDLIEAAVPEPAPEGSSSSTGEPHPGGAAPPDPKS